MNIASVCTLSTADSSELQIWPMKHNIQESSNGLDGGLNWLADWFYNYQWDVLRCD